MNSVIAIFYILICLSWTVLRFIINKKEKKPMAQLILLALFDFFTYPISYVFYTYKNLFNLISLNGTEREEKK